MRVIIEEIRNVPGKGTVLVVRILDAADGGPSIRNGWPMPTRLLYWDKKGWPRSAEVTGVEGFTNSNRRFGLVVREALEMFTAQGEGVLDMSGRAYDPITWRAAPEGEKEGHA